MRHCEVQPESAGLIEIIRNCWGDELLKLVEIDVEGFDSIPFSPFLSSGPEIGKQQRCKECRVLGRDLCAFGRQRYENDGPILDCFPEIQGDARLPENHPHRLIADESLEPAYRAPNLRFEVLGA